MNAEELAYFKRILYENSQIQNAIEEIKLMFQEFTEDKKRHWKEEQIRKREATWG